MPGRDGVAIAGHPLVGEPHPVPRARSQNRDGLNPRMLWLVLQPRLQGLPESDCCVPQGKLLASWFVFLLRIVLTSRLG